MSASKQSRGFTLVELMMSIAILAIVLVYLTQAFTAQQKTYVVVDQVTEAQQNMRAVADLVERDIRRAGYMVPPHAAICGFDATGNADTLFVSNTDAIRTMFQLEGANEDLSGNYGAPVSGVTAAWTASGSSFSLTLDRLWVDVAADGDDFASGAGVIVVNRHDEEGKIACGIITSIGSNTLTVDFGSTSIGPVGLNADVVAVPAHVYALTRPASGPSILRRDGVLLAKDVEDFQVTYYFDLDDDRLVDGGEMFGDDGSAVADAFAEPASSFPDATLLREVQVNVVTATRSEDPNQEFNQGAGQVTGNRDAGTLPSGDGKRRRVSTARVRLRNAG